MDTACRVADRERASAKVCDKFQMGILGEILEEAAAKGTSGWPLASSRCKYGVRSQAAVIYRVLTIVRGGTTSSTFPIEVVNSGQAGQSLRLDSATASSRQR